MWWLASYLASWLYGWYSPPTELVRDIHEIARDAHGRLSRGPIEIPAMRIGRSIAFLLLATAGVVWLFVDSWNRRGGLNDLYVLLFPLTFLMVGWGFYRVVEVRRLRMTLTLDGVTIDDGKGRIACPWALFDVAGAPATFNGMPHRIHLPVNADAIPEVTLTRRDGTEITGDGARNCGFHFGKHGSVHLAAFYAVDSLQLASLLIDVGRAHVAAGTGAMPGTAQTAPMITRRPYKQATRPLRAPGDPITAPHVRGDAAVDHHGWLVVSAVHWVLSPECCVCGEQTDTTYPIHAVTRHFGFFQAGVEYTTAVRCCPECRGTIRQREWLGRCTILLIATLIPLIAMAYFFGWDRFQRLARDAFPVVVILEVILAGLLLRVLWRYGRELYSPVRARYRPSEEKLALYFRRAGYAELALESIRGPAQ